MKRALVTGGSGSIGRAICLNLAAQGHFVYVHANSNLQKAQQTARQIIQQGGQAEALCFDVTDSATVSSALENILQHGEIQILVNNAGIHDDAPMAGMTQQQWNKVIDISLNGFFNVTQPLLLPMMSTRWGRIVSISSIAGIMGNRGQANYAAAKSGLHGASKTLAIELASRGVSVNVVAPGIIESAMTEQVFNSEQIKKIVPMKRAGSAEEVASLVGYLCSQQAGYISGQIISINGAMC
jgi:3-oxoacyl-[acyl-carrier protein] reductase